VAWKQLPINSTSRIHIQVIGTHYMVRINETLAEYFSTNALRESGFGRLYVSDPWVPAANAAISNISMTETVRSSFEESISSFYGVPSKLGLLAQQFVPFNYSLSFDLTPLRTTNQWTNVFHFSKTNTDGSRMPGVWIVPGTTRLHIRVGREEQPNDGIINTLPLPLNAKTKVVIELIRNQALILFNGTIAGYYSLSGGRDHGWATAYFSDPWYPSANVFLENMTVSEIAQSQYATFKNHIGTLKPVKATTGYDITPDGILTKNVTNCGTSKDLMTFSKALLTPIPGSNGQFSIDYQGKLKEDAMLINGTTVKVEYFFPNGGAWNYYSYNMCDFLNVECPAFGVSNQLQTFKIWERNEGMELLAGAWGTKINFKMSAISKGSNQVFCINGAFDYTSSLGTLDMSEVDDSNQSNLEPSNLQKRKVVKSVQAGSAIAFGKGYKAGICMSPACRI
jgi:hypothetical protein